MVHFLASSHWTRITTGSVTSLDYYGGYLYGVGLNRAVYRTKPNGRWTCITTGSVTMIKVYNGIIYGLGMDKAIWKWLGRRWTRITSGSVTYFTISGSRRPIFHIGQYRYLGFSYRAITITDIRNSYHLIRITNTDKY